MRAILLATLLCFSAFAKSDEHLYLPSSHPVTAVISVPENKKPIAKAILIPGSGIIDGDGTVGPNKCYRDLAEKLKESGIVTIRYPKRMKKHPRLTFEHLTMKEEFFEDAIRSFKLLDEDPKYKDLPTFLIGHSLGASLAPHIAKRIKVNGIIMLAASPRSIYNLFEEQLSYLDSLEKSKDTKIHKYYVKYAPICKKADKGRIRQDFNILGFPKVYLEEWKNYNQTSVEAVRSNQIPTLIVGFGTDYQVTSQDYHIYKAHLAKSAHVQFVWLDTLNHFFMEDTKPASPKHYYLKSAVSNKLTNEIAEFITNSL